MTNLELYFKLNNTILSGGIMYDPYGTKKNIYYFWIGKGSGLRIDINDATKELISIDRLGKTNINYMTIEDAIRDILYDKFINDEKVVYDMLDKYLITFEEAKKTV